MGESKCPVGMSVRQDRLHVCRKAQWTTQTCGRDIHHPKKHIDTVPFCIMHSRDPEKSAPHFHKIFKEIVGEALSEDESEERVANFGGFFFPDSNYEGRTFNVRCNFFRAVFQTAANFEKSNFPRGADFSTAEFMGNAKFRGATFKRDADFSSAIFNHDAEFQETVFKRDVSFKGTEFTRKAAFHGSHFLRTVDFTRAKFLSEVHFHETIFGDGRQFKSLKPSPVFAGASFERPEKAFFYKTFLGRALFNNCDISSVEFSSVDWRPRVSCGNERCMVFDEAVGDKFRNKDAYGECGFAGELAGPKGNSIVGELYQKLKKNYDGHTEYRVAGDFHYGEMEMRRKECLHKNKAFGWLQYNFGVLTWYKYISAYGESYLRPGVLLTLALVVFTFLYPLVGLHRDASRAGTPGAVSVCSAGLPSENMTYWSPFQCAGDNGSASLAIGDLLLDSGLTSLEVAAFQKSLLYEPSDRRGRLVAITETAITSSLIALFLLAVRRQFKR